MYWIIVLPFFLWYTVGEIKKLVFFPPVLVKLTRMSSRFYGYRIMLFTEPMSWQCRLRTETAQPFFCAEFSRITARFNFLFLGALLILFFIFDIALYTENSLDCFFPTRNTQPFCFSLLIAFFVVFILFLRLNSLSSSLSCR